MGQINLQTINGVTTMGSAERRVFARVPANFEVDVIHKDNYIISFNRDISVDGMFLCTQNPPPVGSQVRLHFTLDHMEKIELPAIVIWVDTRGPVKEHGIGVQFLDQPSPEFKKSILKLLDRIKILQHDFKYV